jgi:hypothetical protein
MPSDKERAMPPVPAGSKGFFKTTDGGTKHKGPDRSGPLCPNRKTKR